MSAHILCCYCDIKIRNVLNTADNTPLPLIYSLLCYRATQKAHTERKYSPAVKWAAWTRIRTPGFNSKWTRFWFSFWISVSEIWEGKQTNKQTNKAFANLFLLAKQRYCRLSKHRFLSLHIEGFWTEWFVYGQN